MAHYVRGRLHRRLFFLFGAAIFFTGLIFGAAQWSLGGQEWRNEMAAGRDFVGDRFGRVWDDPSQRDELARALADKLHLDVRLEDPGGAPLSVFGSACTKPTFRVPVEREGTAVGAVVVCTERVHPRPRIRAFLPFFVAALVLWGISGKLARHLARPYGELARVARDIGMGKLASRFSLPRRGADEARLLADSINDMADRIEKQMRDQRELLAGVSHEIRTPLARIRLLVELCRANTENGKTVPAATLDDIDREVVEIDALVSELLAGARLDFAAVSPHTLDAKDVAERALVRHSVEPGKLTVMPGPVMFAADPTLVARALANLIENAAVHGGGLDKLIVRPGDDRMAFEAEDRGPGFLPGEEARVFESFYQRPSPNGQSGGRSGALGLGLTLVKRIAEAHGGRAYAKNREGGGATVGIELPLQASRASS